MDYLEPARETLHITVDMGTEFMNEYPETVTAATNVAMLSALIDIAESLRRLNFEAVIQGGEQD